MTITTKHSTGIIHPLQAAKFMIVTVRAMARTMARRRKVRELSELPDYILSDMGLRRDDISTALATDWREDPTYRLAITAGKRRRGLCD